MVLIPEIRSIDWQPSWRLVSSQFPPRGLFDRVADPGNLEVVFAIEALTNDRLRDEMGELSLVPQEDRISGPGTTPIMAAFTHLNPVGSRFTNGSYGVYYAARSVDTAIAETRYHRAKFLAATNEPPIEVNMRSYTSKFCSSMHDIRGKQRSFKEVYHPDRYVDGQIFAKNLRDNGSNGIAYTSVRDRAGECIAVFRPRLLAAVTQGKHYCFVWDGDSISTVYVKSEYIN